MSLTELSGYLFDIFSNFSGLVHDIDKSGTFSTDYESKFDVVFFLFVFILDEETDSRRLCWKNGGKKEQKGNEDM
jgi:hypothetical protein